MTTTNPTKPINIIDNETLPAKVPSSEVVEVLFDNEHEGSTGAALADNGRPQSFKLDHKKGRFHPSDDEDEKYDFIDGVIVNSRAYFRRFGPAGICCESDNGVEGHDRELNKRIKCEGECQWSYSLEPKINGQCSLGLQLQMIAMINGTPTPIQLNMSASSAKAFATYLKKLSRMKKTMRGVTTRIASRACHGGQMDYYAGKFTVEDDKPCVDISPLLTKKPEPEAAV